MKKPVLMSISIHPVIVVFAGKTEKQLSPAPDKKPSLKLKATAQPTSTGLDALLKASIGISPSPIPGIVRLSKMRDALYFLESDSKLIA